MPKVTGVTLFDLDEGDLFAFGYSPSETYQFLRFDDLNNGVVIRRHDDGSIWAKAQEENANPYYNNIIRRG